MDGDVITCRDDLIEALRSRKGELGLSNAFVEHELQMAVGGLDKVLGPSQVKGLSLPVALDLLELFGCRLRIEVDPELEARMRDRYEHRDDRAVRPQSRVSKKLMELALPAFYKRLSKLGNEARKAKLPPEARSKIARAAALSRWRLHRAAAKVQANAATECGAAP
jgi:hypothetical protein